MSNPTLLEYQASGCAGRDRRVPPGPAGAGTAANGDSRGWLPHFYLNRIDAAIWGEVAGVDGFVHQEDCREQGRLRTLQRASLSRVGLAKDRPGAEQDGFRVSGGHNPASLEGTDLVTGADLECIAAEVAAMSAPRTTTENAPTAVGSEDHAALLQAIFPRSAIPTGGTVDAAPASSSTCSSSGVRSTSGPDDSESTQSSVDADPSSQTQSFPREITTKSGALQARCTVSLRDLNYDADSLEACFLSSFDVPGSAGDDKDPLWPFRELGLLEREEVASGPLGGGRSGSVGRRNGGPGLHREVFRVETFLSLFPHSSRSSRKVGSALSWPLIRLLRAVEKADPHRQVTYNFSLADCLDEFLPYGAGTFGEGTKRGGCESHPATQTAQTGSCQGEPVLMSGHLPDGRASVPWLSRILQAQGGLHGCHQKVYIFKYRQRSLARPSHLSGKKSDLVGSASSSGESSCMDVSQQPQPNDSGPSVRIVICSANLREEKWRCNQEVLWIGDFALQSASAEGAEGPQSDLPFRQCLQSAFGSSFAHFLAVAGAVGKQSLTLETGALRPRAPQEDAVAGADPRQKHHAVSEVTTAAQHSRGEIMREAFFAPVVRRRPDNAASGLLVRGRRRGVCGRLIKLRAGSSSLRIRGSGFAEGEHGESDSDCLSIVSSDADSTAGDDSDTDSNVGKRIEFESGTDMAMSSGGCVTNAPSAVCKGGSRRCPAPTASPSAERRAFIFPSGSLDNRQTDWLDVCFRIDWGVNLQQPKERLDARSKFVFSRPGAFPRFYHHLDRRPSTCCGDLSTSCASVIEDPILHRVLPVSDGCDSAVFPGYPVLEEAEFIHRMAELKDGLMGSTTLATEQSSPASEGALADSRGFGLRGRIAHDLYFPARYRVDPQKESYSTSASTSSSIEIDTDPSTRTDSSDESGSQSCATCPVSGCNLILPAVSAGVTASSYLRDVAAYARKFSSSSCEVAAERIDVEADEDALTLRLLVPLSELFLARRVLASVDARVRHAVLHRRGEASMPPWLLGQEIFFIEYILAVSTGCRLEANGIERVREGQVSTAAWQAIIGWLFVPYGAEGLRESESLTVLPGAPVSGVSSGAGTRPAPAVGVASGCDSDGYDEDLFVATSGVLDTQILKQAGVFVDLEPERCDECGCANSWLCGQYFEVPGAEEVGHFAREDGRVVIRYKSGGELRNRSCNTESWGVSRSWDDWSSPPWSSESNGQRCEQAEGAWNFFTVDVLTGSETLVGVAGFPASGHGNGWGAGSSGDWWGGSTSSWRDSEWGSSQNTWQERKASWESTSAMLQKSPLFSWWTGLRARPMGSAFFDDLDRGMGRRFSANKAENRLHIIVDAQQRGAFATSRLAQKRLPDGSTVAWRSEGAAPSFSDMVTMDMSPFAVQVPSCAEFVSRANARGHHKILMRVVRRSRTKHARASADGSVVSTMDSGNDNVTTSDAGIASSRPSDSSTGESGARFVVARRGQKVAESRTRDTERIVAATSKEERTGWIYTGSGNPREDVWGSLRGGFITMGCTEAGVLTRIWNDDLAGGCGAAALEHFAAAAKDEEARLGSVGDIVSAKLHALVLQKFPLPFHPGLSATGCAFPPELHVYARGRLAFPFCGGSDLAEISRARAHLHELALGVVCGAYTRVPIRHADRVGIEASAKSTGEEDRHTLGEAPVFYAQRKQLSWPQLVGVLGLPESVMRGLADARSAGIDSDFDRCGAGPSTARLHDALVTLWYQRGSTPTTSCWGWANSWRLDIQYDPVPVSPGTRVTPSSVFDSANRCGFANRTKVFECLGDARSVPAVEWREAPQGSERREVVDSRVLEQALGHASSGQVFIPEGVPRRTLLRHAPVGLAFLGAEGYAQDIAGPLTGAAEQCASRCLQLLDRWGTSRYEDSCLGDAGDFVCEEAMQCMTERERYVYFSAGARLRVTAHLDEARLLGSV